MPFYNSQLGSPTDSEQHTIGDRMADIPLDHDKMLLVLPSHPLPSNAPALPQLEEYGVYNRPFQGRCSSRQEELLDFDNQRPGQFSPAESAFIHDFRRGKYPNVKHMSAEDIIKEANQLWRRLLRCKAYSKYRERKPKDTPSPQDSKWPEHLEVAFCQALIIYPPVGRRMVASGDSNKARGRNELIADFIQRYTREARTRKQVSSHIQVLKPMVKEDPIVMDHLAVPEHKPIGRSGRRSRRASEASTSSTRYSSHDSAYMPHQGIRSTSYRSMSYRHSVSPSRPSIPAPAFIHVPVHFEMFTRNTRDNTSVPFHTFTSFNNPQARLGDLQVADAAELCACLPQLSSILLPDDLTNAQIIVAKSRLCLLPGTLLKGEELGIEFEINSLCNLEVYEDFTCKTRFFEGGMLACDPILERIEYNAPCQRMGNIQFGSNFWARKVIEMTKQMRRTEDLRHQAERIRSCGLEDSMSELAEPLEDEAKESDEAVKKSIEGIAGLQEISAKFKATGEQVRLLVVCWNFEQVLDEGDAKTTWRNVAVGTARNHMGQENQLQYSLAQHEVLRHNNSFGPGSFVEDISCVLPPHLQQRPSSSPLQLQQSHCGLFRLSTDSVVASDINSSTLDYSNPLSNNLNYPQGLQISFDPSPQVSFSSSFHTPSMGSFDASFDNSRSFDATIGAQNTSPYRNNVPWRYNSHGPYGTGYFPAGVEDDDTDSQGASFSTHSYALGQRHGSEDFRPHPRMDDSRRHSVATSVSPYDNSPVYTPSYTPSPFIPCLSSFAEEAQRRGSVGLIPDRVDARRHSLASTPFSQEVIGHLTPASAAYAEGRRGSMGY